MEVGGGGGGSQHYDLITTNKMPCTADGSSHRYILNRTVESELYESFPGARVPDNISFDFIL